MVHVQWEWCHQEVEQSSIGQFDSFIETLRKYKEQISNYFRKRETSGFVEGFNNKVKVSKRRCYGILSVETFFQRLFLDTMGYGIFLGRQRVEAIWSQKQKRQRAQVCWPIFSTGKYWPDCPSAVIYRNTVSLTGCFQDIFCRYFCRNFCRIFCHNTGKLKR